MSDEKYAVCRSDPDYWFRTETAQSAARICLDECSMIAECAEAHASMPYEQRKYGVWAGRRAYQRNRVVTCADCEKDLPVYARGRCRKCYARMKVAA